MKLTRKLTALAMAVLLAFTLTACSPKAWAQDTVVKLVKAMGLVEESEDDDTDTTTKAAAGGSVEFPEGMDTSAARVVTTRRTTRCMSPSTALPTAPPSILWRAATA